MVDTGRMPGRKVRFSGIVVAVVLSGLAVSGCASSKYHYVKNSGDGAYFKIPNAWHLYDQDALLKKSSSGLTAEQLQAQRAQQWQVAFDGNPKPSLKHLGSYTVGYPAGLALVQKISATDAETVSLQQLADVFGVQTAVQNGTAQIIAYQHITRDGGFRGIHLVAQIQRDSGGTGTVDQTTLVDQATTKIYALIISCTSKCFESQQDKIDQVISSWTLKAS
jgi:hypothetical protein